MNDIQNPSFLDKDRVKTSNCSQDESVVKDILYHNTFAFGYALNLTQNTPPCSDFRLYCGEIPLCVGSFTQRMKQESEYFY